MSEATASTLLGVLALQGDFAAHEEAVARAGGAAIAVRKPEDLARIDGLIMPGGESTTLLKHFERYGFERPLRRFAEAGGTLFGTCAGTILLAREVRNPAQRSLALADVVVERNAYGRQCESFRTELEVPALGEEPLEAIFIRAPRILAAGAEVDVLAEYEDAPVLARSGRLLLATFHPELTADARVHRLFLQMTAENARAREAETSGDTR